MTGASRGLGRAFAEEALATGDRVVGAARDVTPLDDLCAEHAGRLVTLPLDVLDRAAVFDTVDKAAAAFGRLDVVVNNAGQLLMGMLEEITEAQARAHFDTNVFGALWVAQAVVPHLRAQGSGHILQVSSMGSLGGFASVGLYSAGKAALDSLSEALAMEVEPFGIDVTILQPGGYATDLFTRGTTATTPDDAYADLRARLAETWAEAEDPDPRLAAPVVREIAGMDQPPKRLLLGSTSYDLVQEMVGARLDEHRRWEHLSRRAGPA
ncbi:SDR family NAD(P)-dependent oxidoreductase [Prauserella oleivorans]|uniref:SDR family NAD(P)-dependent oxidoreductase n=1 Tax=Prauserella oleivorans TaxID=1478153 RepID=A0ABW5WAK2_9PSEU